MGRPKGGKNKYWTAEDKLKIIKPILDFEISTNQKAREMNLSAGMITNWIKSYKENGFEGLKAKKKPGNPLSSLMNKKELSDIEKLELEIMKLRIENERLKKGYLVKGDGSIVVFKK